MPLFRAPPTASPREGLKLKRTKTKRIWISNLHVRSSPDSARKREIFKSGIVGWGGNRGGLITTARNYLASYRERRERTGRRNELMIKDKYQRREGRRTEETRRKGRKRETSEVEENEERKGRKLHQADRKDLVAVCLPLLSPFLSPPPPPTLSLFPLFFPFVSFHPPIFTRPCRKARRRTKISRIYTR